MMIKTSLSNPNDIYIKNYWHFSRPKLASRYMVSFELGLSSAYALFAPRRMGKTEFLKEDFIPAAKAAGYFPIYVNLGNNSVDPASALVSAFDQSFGQKGFLWMWAKVRGIRKLSGVGDETNKTMRGALLSQAMRAFDKDNKSIVLVIDEAQVIGQEENSDVAHALRAGLDIRKDRIKVLFAGNSEQAMRRMFGRISEPFYNWAALEPFEIMGEEFVAAMAQKIAEISSSPLPMADALRAYEELKRTPEFFKIYLNRYLTYPFDGTQGALEFTKKQVFKKESFGNA